MKKLFIFLTMLVLGIVSSWAFDVTVIKSSESETTYGSLTSTTFTTNSTSGLSGVTVSGVTILKNTGFAYGSSLGFENVTSGTITLSAPEGYTILGYSLTARSNTYSVSYTLTPAAGGSSVTTSTSGVTLVASGVNSQTTTISYTAGSQNHFYIPSLVITVKPDTKESVNVVYKEVYEGAVKCTHNVVTQVEGEAPGLPSGLRTAGCTYKYYTTEACTGEELSVLTSSTTEVYAKVTFTAFTFSSGFDGATWYYVYFNRAAGKRYWQMDPNTTPYPDKSSKPSVSEALWAFTGNPYDGIKVMNARAGDGYYLKKTGTSNGAAITMQEGGDTWAIGTGDGGFTLKQDGTNIFMHDYNIKLAVWNSGSAANDKGSAIVVEAASPVKVTYKLTYNGNVISSYTKDLYELVGATAAAPFDWELPAYCSLGSCTPATITAETTEVTIPLNWNGPFEISSDFENANWYYLKMHGQYLINSGSTSCSLTDLATAETAGYNAFGAFVGDPLNGFQMINKAAGSDKNLVVSSSSWTPSMGDGETKLLLQKWNDDFALRTSSYLYLNNVDGTLKLWVSGTSTEGKNFDCSVESASYRGLALDFIDDYANDHALGQYFGVSTATYNNVRASYADAASVSESDYTQLVTYIGGMLPASYPETGYYRIKSNSGRYIGYGQPVADPMPSVGLRTVSAEDAAKDVSTIIRLVKGVGSHQYTLSTEGLNVQSMKSSNTPFPATNDVGATFVLTASTTNPGKGTIYNAASNDKDNDNVNGYLHENSWSVPGVVNGSASSPNSQWVVEDVTGFDVAMNGPVDGNYYATLCVPFDVTISDGNATAYTLAKSESGNYLVPTEVDQVPAGTPVLLKGTSATATLTIGSGYAATPLTTTALTGTYVAKTINGSEDYVFGRKDEKVGFYHWDSDNLAANRAYLAAGSVAPGARGFVLNFDDEATGIVAPTADTAGETTIYNLSGQRLNKVQKGINIVNGKKVLF